jgi:hypothetical protein
MESAAEEKVFPLAEILHFFSRNVRLFTLTIFMTNRADSAGGTYAFFAGRR